MDMQLRLFMLGVLLAALLLAGCASAPANKVQPADTGPTIVPSSPSAPHPPPQAPAQNLSPNTTTLDSNAANQTISNPGVGAGSMDWSGKKALYITQMMVGDELKFDGGRLELLNIARAGTPTATLRLMDFKGNSASRLELSTNRSAQFRGDDGVDYLAVAVFDMSEGARPVVQIQLYKVKDLAQSPSRIAVGDPQNAYVLTLDYPLPLMLANESLSVGQAVNGTAFDTMLAAVGFAGQAPQVSYRLLDGQGQGMAQFSLLVGQMMSFYAPDGKHYSVVFRKMEQEKAVTEVYQLQAFGR